MAKPVRDFFGCGKRNNDRNKKRSGKFSAAFPTEFRTGPDRIATGCAY
jgi:hypothetical protein